MLTSGAHVPGLAAGSECKIRSIQALPLRLTILLTSNNEAIFQLLRAPIGGKMLFNHLRYYKVLQVGMLVVLSLMEVCDVLLGTPGVSLDRFFFKTEEQRVQTQISQEAL